MYENTETKQISYCLEHKCSLSKQRSSTFISALFCCTHGLFLLLQFCDWTEDKTYNLHKIL